MNHNKNVLHLVEHLYLGGIERLLEQLALHTREGTRLHFFTYETKSLAGIGKAIQDAGFPVFTYKKSAGRDWNLVKELIKVIKENKIDVIHTHDFGPTEYAVLLKMRFPRLRLVHTQHTMHHFIIKPQYRYFFQFASYFYHEMIGVSGFVKDSIIENCPLVNRSVLTVIPNGVDTQKFVPTPEINSTGKSLHMVSIARISYEKNLEYLFNTCRLLKEAGIPFTFDHAGTSKTPEPREKLENFVKEHGLESQVTMHGFKNDASEILAKGDIFLSSSIREGHPVAVLEAMATEKVCLCSDIAPHRETSHGVLELYDLQDETALFNKLKDMHISNTSLAERKRQSREIVLKHYSLEKMVQSYVDTYR
ncbi:glycosyltransferase family 4 protein [Bdellovibrio sp. HCB274]|uniref:glycosyltransferase family 4 protein n=1 Tax=Bdellovibrio sp. HCB274 TaxID=3394361 RepID=UPI0039B58AAD